MTFKNVNAPATLNVTVVKDKTVVKFPNNKGWKFISFKVVRNETLFINFHSHNSIRTEDCNCFAKRIALKNKGELSLFIGGNASSFKIVDDNNEVIISLDETTSLIEALSETRESYEISKLQC